MKEYKGWQIVKMASEGKLKEGDIFKDEDDNFIKYKNKNMRYRATDGDYIVEVGFSTLCNEHIYTKIQKPLTFFEAMAKADEGEKVTNDYLKDKDGDYKSYYFKYNNKLYYRNIVDDMDAIFPINESEIVSSWYIYEK